jgi:hypothetical protein
VIERVKWGENGVLVAEAYKISGNGLIVSFWEKPVQWGRMECTVTEWDKFDLYDKREQTFTNWEEGFRTYLDWAFGVKITN